MARITKSSGTAKYFGAAFPKVTSTNRTMPNNVGDGKFYVAPAPAPAPAPVTPTRTPPRSTPPRSTPPTATTTRRTTGSSGGSSGGASSGIKKSNDAPQLAALQRMIDKDFAAGRDVRLGNIKRLLSDQEAALIKVYDERLAQLLGSRDDNEASAADASFANFANRARERQDIISEAAAVGAGETDTLRAQIQALQNWSANQADINRSYFDTARSVANTITDLDADTRTARLNAHRQAQSDQEQVWSNYYSQLTDAWTQVGNIRGNPYSDSYQAGHNAFDMAAKTAGKSWSAPGAPASIAKWEGSTEETQQKLNNTVAGKRSTNLAAKAPEGASLRKWS